MSSKAYRARVTLEFAKINFINARVTIGEIRNQLSCRGVDWLGLEIAGNFSTKSIFDFVGPRIFCGHLMLGDRLNVWVTHKDAFDNFRRALAALGVARYNAGVMNAETRAAFVVR